MEEKRVRVRLKFQDPDILKSQQIVLGLSQSWYLVRLEDVHTIADVAFDIRHAFHLEESCPNGLTLEVDGFVLPASQPARLLKDSDLIRIYKVRRSDNQGQISHEAWNDHMVNKEWLANGGLNGVELRALDEFEKETGGYESEQEEGEMETDVSLEEVKKDLTEIRPSPFLKKAKDRSAKKHKRTNNVVPEKRDRRRCKVPEARQELATAQVEDKSDSDLKCGVPLILGVECQAVDELDTGNNKEEENGADKALSGRGKKKSQAASERSHIKKEKTGKKRKRKEMNMEEQVQIIQNGEKGLTSNGVEYTAEPTAELFKAEERQGKPKKRSSASLTVGADDKSVNSTENLQGKSVEANTEDVQQEGPSKKKKKKRVISSVDEDSDAREGILKEETAVDKVGKLKRREDADLQRPAEKHRTQAVETSEESVPARASKRKANDEATPAKTTRNETNTRIPEQRPSRSARRKKAKRQWLREAKLQMAKSAGGETPVSERTDLKLQILGKLDGSPVVEEVLDVEAEEEVLPIVVRAGHIRFEPYSKDEILDQARHSTPAILVGDKVKTKRQGQNWGQEKNTEKHKDERWATEAINSQEFEVSGDTRFNNTSDHQIDPPNFEQHPALDGPPQEGDVLAYRLVELTLSWTPEISPYRVGVVAHWEKAINMIKLNPHPDYPCFAKKDSVEDEEDFRNAQGMETDGPYDENGVLEVEFSSLVEVRLIQRVDSKNQNQVPSPNVEIERDVGPTIFGDQPVDNATSEHNANIKKITPTGDLQGEEDKNKTESSGWQTVLSEELERKKTELCQRDVSITKPSTDAIFCEQPENTSAGSEGGIDVNQAKSGRGRKFKFLRSAGVGSIVTLLRAQDAL